MDRETKLRLIDELCQDLPPYASSLSGPFIPGQTTVMYSGPFWDKEETKMAMQALLMGQWLPAGEYVARFQNMFSQRFNVKHSHMLNSGSSANLVLIAALKKYYNWQDGDEIIVSPVGFPTTISPIAQNNLKPIFVDIEMRTLNFDVSQIESKITDRTRAIFVSPVLGNPPDMDALVDICKRHDIKLVGDNCDSLGTLWNGKLMSDLYCAWSTSFYPAHHITTGEGGMVCSNDTEFMKTVTSIAWWGRDCYCVGKANQLACGTCGIRFSKWLLDEGLDLVMDHKYIFTNMGYNLKPLDLQGAIGLAQLKKLDIIEHKRREHKIKIEKFFDGNPNVHVVDSLLQADPCWFGVPLVCSSAEVKHSLVAHLEDAKIQTRNYFAGNILLHPGYKHLGNASDFPVANEVLKLVLWIGCTPHYTPEVLKYIGDVIGSWQI